MNDFPKELEALKKLAELEAQIKKEQSNDDEWPKNGDNSDFSIHIASLKYMAKERALEAIEKIGKEWLRKYWLGVKEDANE